MLSDPTPLSEGRNFGVLSPQICRVSNQETGALGRNASLAMEAYLAHRLDEPLGPAARVFADALTRIAAHGGKPASKATPRKRR